MHRIDRQKRHADRIWIGLHRVWIDPRMDPVDEAIAHRLLELIAILGEQPRDSTTFVSLHVVISSHQKSIATAVVCRTRPAGWVVTLVSSRWPMPADYRKESELPAALVCGWQNTERQLLSPPECSVL